MKKSLSLILALAMVFTMFASVVSAAEETTTAPTVTAATYTPEQAFEFLKTAGIVEGDPVKGANLDGNLTRAEFSKVIAKLWNLTEAPEGSTVYSDLAGAGWAAGYIGAATKAGLLNGMGGGKFNPQGNVKLEEIAKVVATGFKLTAVPYAGTGKVSTWAKGYVGAVIAAKLVADSTDFTKAAKRGEIFTIGYTAYVVSTTPVATPVPASKALDIASAVALNSKVVEVTLGTAAVAADLDVANASVKDAAGTVVAVASVTAAPYVSDGKTILVTLGADSKAGTLYTLTSGTKSVNFGGKAVDTDKPTVDTVEGTDAYEVTVTFSEAVKLDAAKFVLAERYGAKTALEVKSFKYTAANTVVITTADQKNATLYGADISGVADFAGNTMDSNTAQTFTGIAAPTADTKVLSAGSNNPDEAVVQFDINLDPATLVVGAFKVEEAYGSKTVLTVTAARLATTDDKDSVGTTALTAAGAKKSVIISVTGLKASTLYKVTATGVKTLYGKGQDSSAVSATFSGTPIPTAALIYTITGGVASSNTQVTLVYAYKAVKADAENVANYAIAEAYGAKAALAVTKAELQSDGKTVKLTVAPLAQLLYKLTVTNVKDIYGNAIKTADSANIVSFSGVPVAAKIAAISGIAYTGSTNTKILVTFDGSVGSNAKDVSLYTIDTSIGYPAKAETTANAREVILTIPKLNDGDIYKLTVKGILNADGVVSDSAGISSTFVGKGITLGAPKLQGIFATDNQTLKIYFDRDVTKSTVKGATKVWDANTLIGSTLTYDKVLSGVTTNTVLAGVAYQDATDKNALIVRVATNDAFAAGAFTLKGSTLFDADNKTLAFPANSTEPTEILVDNVQALNNKTLRVYFNQPVYGTLTGFATVKVTTSGGTTTTTLTSKVAVDSTNKVFDFALSTALVAANTSVSLQVANSATATPSVITDDVRNTGTRFVGIKDETTGVALVAHIRAFANNTAAPADLKDISVISTDNRTLKVYFPTLMDTSVANNTNGFSSATVLDFDNYTIYNGVPAVINTGAADIGKITYDSADNTATITLNKALTASTTGTFLQISTDVKNAVGTQAVADGVTPIKKQFVISATGAAKVTVSSATYAAATQSTITIKLNQEAKTTGSNLVQGAGGANVRSVLDVTYKKLVGSVVTEFKLQLSDIVSVTANNGGTNVADTDAGFFDTIEITLNSSLNGVIVSGQTGKVEINVTTLIGINGNASDADSSVTFAQN